MSLAISTALLDAILAHARASPASECCGLLLGRAEDRLVTSILPAANVAAQPEQRFEIDPAVLLAAYRAARSGGPAILGHYHSHPGGDPIPSTVDAAMAEARGEVWLIVGGTGEVRAWRASPHGALHGRFDPTEITASDQLGLAPAGPCR